MTRKTDDFIHSLAEDLTPKKAVVSAFVPISALVAFAAAFIYAWVFVTGQNPHTPNPLSPMARKTYICVYSFAGFAALLTAFYATLRMTQKGQYIQRLKYMPFLILGGVILLQLYRWSIAEVTTLSYTYAVACAVSVFTLTLVGGGIVLACVRRYGTLAPHFASLCAGVFGGCVGMIGRLIICPIGDPAQLLSYHLLPVTVGMGILYVVGPKFIKW